MKNLGLKWSRLHRLKKNTSAKIILLKTELKHEKQKLKKINIDIKKLKPEFESFIEGISN